MIELWRKDDCDTDLGDGKGGLDCWYKGDIFVHGGMVYYRIVLWRTT